MKKLSIVLASLGLCSLAYAQSPAVTFKKVQLSDKFYTEGVAYGDFNKDGKMDVVAGPYWYEGPDFAKKHEIYTPKAYEPKNYSENFLTFTYDFNGDGYADVLQVGFPGKETFWYENPGKNAEGAWKKHLVHPVVENENPTFGDIDGDGKPELIFNSGGYLGYAKADWANPDKPWTFHAISPKGNYQRFTHGIDFGDINGDGRMDLIEATGWWEQPAKIEEGKPWVKHPFAFTTDAAQMLVYDVDGDGLNDVITVMHPHRYGLVWYKQVRDAAGQISFQKNVIMGEKPADNAQGVMFTQPHALILKDLYGTGLKGILVGKRFWAHGEKGDVDPGAPAVIYFFELQRDKTTGVKYVAHLIDDNSGVGLQVEAADLNGDGIPDPMSSNKKGTFIFLSQKK